MAAAAKVQQEQATKNSAMATPPSSPTTTARKPLLLFSISLPVLAFVFLVSHTTFSLLICPLLPKSTSGPNVTISNSSASLDVSMEMTMQMQGFHHIHVSPPPPIQASPAVSKSSRKKASTKRNKSLLKLLLRETPQTRQFAARAAELYSGPCADGRFFMTWLSPLAQFGRRELLVLESLFRWHPRACLLVASDTMDSAGGAAKLAPFTDRGLRVAAATPDLAYLLRGTPAEAWLAAARRGGVSPGSIPLGQNLSNLLRLALLHRYGGVYLDADVLVLTSFFSPNGGGGGLPHNAVGAQAADAATGGWRRLNNAVMAFDAAHPALREFMAEFAATFDGSRWGHNGPYLVSRVLARLAGGGGVAVLPPRAFYPVDWIKIGGLFRAPRDRGGERWVKAKVENIRGGSFGIHLWNRETRGVEIEEGSVIARLVVHSCLFCNSSSMSVKQE
ncbi:hypothetical protein PR202_gb14902 [Eleusine coracana subsp. coracana]|uniref:Alpha 1,4-glycosyltransferase domain-containing protein n=1 Tax=Eleusine coracana subsp. coracana TaxID=191504 RepID=A0AAV5EXH4_ELECO|nr:hypothetical protein QOZ80_4BG0340680 [Eleusine coracana subsp. coracana]GJN26935.1 hypothetical protein PR202_gb14902 [Eleusine coracana subsp. coracana]